SKLPFRKTSASIKKKTNHLKSTLLLGCFQGLDLRGHERNPIEKRIRQAELLCRSSRAKPELAFICIGQRPMLWLFRPLTWAVLHTFDRKRYCVKKQIKRIFFLI